MWQLDLLACVLMVCAIFYFKREKRKNPFADFEANYKAYNESLDPRIKAIYAKYKLDKGSKK